LNNTYTNAWRRIGELTTRPRAILSISAHWFVPGTGVTVSTAPRTPPDWRGKPRRGLEGAELLLLVRRRRRTRA